MTMKRQESCIEKETHKYIALCHTLIYAAMNSKNHVMNFNLHCNACFSVYCIFQFESHNVSIFTLPNFLFLVSPVILKLLPRGRP